MKVLAFGIVKELFGAASVEVDAAANITALKEVLCQRYPQLQKLSSFMIAINGTYAGPDSVIQDGDEIAIIPPVSGG